MATPNLVDLLADLPPSIEHRCLEYCFTKLGRSTPSIEHRCLEYHYTKLGRSTGRFTSCQSCIDALNMATPNLADLLADLSPSIEHRCFEYHYTKLGRSPGRSPPGQLSIDALHAATPNLADVLADGPLFKHRSLEDQYSASL